MAATKYIPQHLAGILVDATPEIAFSPGADPEVLEEILTGIVIANHSDDPRQLSLWYTQPGPISIYLMHELSLPGHSTTNLDLYLPLVAGQNLTALASVADEISLTLYGLKLVNV